MPIPIEPAQLMLFAAAGLALNLTPGSDMLYCLGQGLKSGPRAGLAAGIGINTGALIHILLAAFGLAALLAAYPLAFEAVRWLGVIYLVWLAVQAFRGTGGALAPKQAKSATLYKAWRDGVFVNLFNPKVAIFVLAFIPQFIQPQNGSPLVQFLIFGLVFCITGTVVNGLVGAFAGGFGKVLATNARIARRFEIITGCVFLGLAAKLAFDER